MLTNEQKRRAFDLFSLDDLERIRGEHPGKFYCPPCGTASDRFLTGGAAKKRANARCPNCGALERHRLLWLCLMTAIWPRLPEGKKDILHIAPEKVFVDLLKGHSSVNYISGDLMVPDAMLKLDLTKIQFWDNKLDLIICSHILEHIPSDRDAMREMLRVLKPGGFLLVMVPTYGETTYEDFSITDPEKRLVHFGQRDHVRKYGMDIGSRLAEAGFTITVWPEQSKSLARLLSFISAPQRVVFVGQKI